VIFSANIVGSKIVEALPTFPPEILNQLLKNKSLIMTEKMKILQKV
jgi:hypothetical protein